MKYLIVFFLLLYCNTLVCHAFFDRDVHILNMQNGLADNTVLSIYKDKDGFMWFGTTNGLSRYDGRNINSFNTGNTELNITEIKELIPYCLGILANGKLYCFNRRTEKFIPLIVESEKDSIIWASSFQPNQKEMCWTISNRSLELYHLSNITDNQGQVIGIAAKKTKSYADLIDKPERFSNFAVMNNRKNLCLITNQSQLLLFYPDQPKAVKSIQLSDNTLITVNDIYESNGIIWVSTVGKGILRYHLRSGHIDQVTYEGPGKNNKLSHTDSFQVIEINKNRYLSVTWSGYTLLIPNKEHSEELTTEIYNNTASQIYQNLETRMLSAYYDPNGIIWIGTNGGGVMYSDLRSQFYNQYHQERHNEICGIEIDNENYIWAATYHRGIMRSEEPFSLSKKLNLTSVGTPEISSKETVLCTLKDQDGTLWFGNKDGTITSYNKQTKLFTIHTLNNEEKTNHSPIWALHIDQRKQFWVGTENGLWLFDPQSKSSHRVPIEKELKNNTDCAIKAIKETSDGTLWIGSVNQGLCRFVYRSDHTFTIKNNYEAQARLHTGDIRSLLAATDGYIYIGYSNGFAVFSPKKDTIEYYYTTHDGLCSNFIGCITEDEKGRIWLGTNSGIVRYSRHSHLFYNYYISGSNRSASFYNHFLFWGNNKSLTYFNPNDLDAYQSTNQVRITALEVNNRPVELREKLNGQVILQKGISFTDFIQLSNSNRDFAITFNNLSYSEEQQKYNYRLLPYQKNWQIADKGRRASYTNLPAGIYTFEVANIYPNGSNGEITTLQIEIEPHWSHSFIFRMCLFILFMMMLAYLWYYIKRRQKRMEHEMQMKHELFTLNMEREKEHQILVERENFFTGAAHELRTPLTLILSPLQELLQQTQPTNPIYSRLLTMYKNGSSLHTLVDHFLYLQKIEAGMVKLRLSEADIVTLVKDIADSFIEIAEIKEIHFEVFASEKSMNLWMDTEKITSAIRNLLSNAFKYTPSKGSIKVIISRKNKDEKDFCQITVSDTGTGIPQELQNRIFDSFITGDNTPSFSTKVGVGLRIVKNTADLHHGLIMVESSIGKGTIFKLLIPEGKAHFTADCYETINYKQENNSIKADTLLHSSVYQENTKKPGNGEKLLIIEDNKGMREYIKSLFTHRYIIIEASNGEEGVNFAVSELPDCIISDVMMPIKDGFTCCQEIRQRQETAHIPILLLTAKAEDADVLQGSKSGADDYMMKPFNPELLKAKVESLIIQRERLKRIYTKALMLKQESNSEEKENVFMQQVINVIEANLSDENFNVKALAEQLNMSQPTLYRKMKQHSSLAVIDIIRSVRVSKAASLIMENKYSIQEISERVGFSDARTLRKHFTEQFGVSPSKYISDKIE